LKLSMNRLKSLYKSILSLSNLLKTNAFPNLLGRSTAEVDVEKVSVEEAERNLAVEKHVRERRNVTVDVEGTCSYMAFRRFLFSTLCSDMPNEILDRPRVLIEGKGNPERVHIEAESKNIIYTLGNGLNLISVGHVLGVIYRSDVSEIRWREPRRVWGKATQEIVQALRRNGIRVRVDGGGKAAQPKSGGRLENGQTRIQPKEELVKAAVARAVAPR